MMIYLIVLGVETISADYVMENIRNMYYPEDVINEISDKIRHVLNHPDFNKKSFDKDYSGKDNDDNDINNADKKIDNYKVEIDQNYIYHNYDTLEEYYDNKKRYNFKVNNNGHSHNYMVPHRDVSVQLHGDHYEDIVYGHQHVRRGSAKTKSNNNKNFAATKKADNHRTTTKYSKKNTVPKPQKLNLVVNNKNTTTAKNKTNKSPTAWLDQYQYVNMSTYDESQNSFGSLPEYEARATPAKESEYQWIARVVHSQNKPYPHVSTAVCIDRRIFITSARSVFSLKVPYTSVSYSGKQAPVIAILLPDKPSKQYYDDIGILVVKDGYITNWHPIKMFQATRTDIYFNWLENRNLNENGPLYHKAVGYAATKTTMDIGSADNIPPLVEIDVVFGLEICVLAYAFLGNGLTGYHIPCFYPCTPKELITVVSNKTIEHNCAKYLGVSGAAVLNTRTNTLMGVATWGETASKMHYSLPVGVAIPNSKRFLDDYECAKKIRNDKKSIIASGYYGSLCN